jgi:hypothetical protein
MLKNAHMMEEFEREWIRRRRPSLRENLKIVEMLLREALQISRFPRDPLDGIEIDIKVARAVNGVREAPEKDRERAR